jgi:hypothetical protein
VACARPARPRAGRSAPGHRGSPRAPGRSETGPPRPPRCRWLRGAVPASARCCAAHGRPCPARGLGGPVHCVRDPLELALDGGRSSTIRKVALRALSSWAAAELTGPSGPGQALSSRQPPGSSTRALMTSSRWSLARIISRVALPMLLSRSASTGAPATTPPSWTSRMLSPSCADSPAAARILLAEHSALFLAASWLARVRLTRGNSSAPAPCAAALRRPRVRGNVRADPRRLAPRSQRHVSRAWVLDFE